MAETACNYDCLRLRHATSHPKGGALYFKMLGEGVDLRSAGCVNLDLEYDYSYICASSTRPLSVLLASRIRDELSRVLGRAASNN